jgi:hypothetical protein
MTLRSTGEPLGDPNRRLLRLEIRSSLVFLAVVALVAVIGLTTQNHSNGKYLIWGSGIGLLCAANQTLIAYVVPKLAGSASNETQRLINLRTKVHMMECLVTGVTTGALSAIFDNVVFVLIGTIVLAVANIIPYVLMPVVLKRLRNGRAG